MIMKLIQKKIKIKPRIKLNHNIYIRFKENIKVKEIGRHNRSLSSFLKSSDSGSFTSGLAGGHLYHLYSTLIDNLR